MKPNDIVITGPPRSGTTLTCELLNTVPDTVALDEPIDIGPWVGRPASMQLTHRRWWRRRPPPQHPDDPSNVVDPVVFCDLIERFFADARAGLLSGEGAISKAVSGQIIGNKFADRRGRSGRRESLATRSLIAVDKPLSQDFILAVKHVAGFSAMLGALSERFRCYAIVRHPLSTLSSWQTIESNFGYGRAPRAERLDPELKSTLDALPEVIDRQFALLCWYYEKFASCLDASRVIRYEDIVGTGGGVLAAISPSAADLDRSLVSRNRASVYDRQTMKDLGERLLAEDGQWWLYYSRDSVRELMEADAQ